MVNIAVLGYGTVGSGVVYVLENNEKSIKEKAGELIYVKHVLDLRDFPDDEIQKRIVHDYDIILKDDEIKVVVEVMGGVEPAFTFVKEAMLRGKSVVTSNKALVAAKGSELMRIARDNDVNFLFEASVGGGIPIIRPLTVSYTADVILKVRGILNGTTNYMLTRMKDAGITYGEALAEAQSKGYAEADPSADVLGYDTCRKTAILGSLSYGNFIDYEDIYTEGIDGVTDVDFEYAKELGTSIKLLGISQRIDEGIAAMVSPFMISETDPLYPVSDVFNAIMITGNMVGDTMCFGRGAGKEPTASAVVADVVEAVRNEGRFISPWWDDRTEELLDPKELEHRFFVRVKAGEAESWLEAFPGSRVVQLAAHEDEFALITNSLKEMDFDRQISGLNGIISYIRCDF